MTTENQRPGRRRLPRIAAVALVVGLVLAGAGAAWAATSGNDMSVSTNGAYVSNAHWGLKDSVCQFHTNPSEWDGHVSGKFVVTTATDHLNSTVDGYGWTKIVQANSKGTYSFDKCIIARGDVLYHESISLQACREHWYGDDCKKVTKP